MGEVQGEVVGKEGWKVEGWGTGDETGRRGSTPAFSTIHPFAGHEQASPRFVMH